MKTSSKLNKKQKNKISDNETIDNQVSDNEASDNEASDNEASNNEASDNEASDNEASDNNASDNDESDNDESDNEFEEINETDIFTEDFFIKRDYLSSKYFNNPTIIKVVTENYLNLTNKIKNDKKNIKVFETEKKYLSKKIIPFMQKKKVNVLNINNVGSIKHRTFNKPATLTKNIILQGIADFFGEDQYLKFMEYLNNNRKTKEINSLYTSNK